MSLSGNSEPQASCLADICVALIEKAEAPLFNQIPDESRLCRTKYVQSKKSDGCDLLVILREVPTDCIPDEDKDTFHQELKGPLSILRLGDIVTLPSDWNARVDPLLPNREHLGNPLF